MEPLNLSPATVPLQELLRRFDAGEYQLPAFQRPFVWKVRQTLNLLDSLLRGYPINVIYLWEPGPTSKLRPKARTFKPKDGTPKVDRFKAFVIDGQQRLTSLHAAFGFAEAFDSGNGRSLECWLEMDKVDRRDGKVTSLFQSPAQKKFLREDDAQQRPWRIRLRDLLDTPHQRMRDERMQQLRLEKYTAEEIDRAMGRIDAAYRMLGAPITCITITQSDDEEVLAVFKRLNRGGTGLKERDVRAADLGIGKSVEVLQQIQSFVNEQLPTALGFGFSFAFRALVVFHKGTAQFNQLPTSWADAEGDRGQSLRDSWREAEKGLRAAMAFVDHIGWSRKPLLVVRIARTVVSPEFRGLGLAAVLVKHAAKFARSHWNVGRLKPLFMEITADMLRYVPFVERAGNRHSGIFRMRRRPSVTYLDSMLPVRTRMSQRRRYQPRTAIPTTALTDRMCWRMLCASASRTGGRAWCPRAIA